MKEIDVKKMAKDNEKYAKSHISYRCLIVGKEEKKKKKQVSLVTPLSAKTKREQKKEKTKR